MGYSTDYNLTQERNPITPVQLAAAIAADEEMHYALNDDGSTKEGSKWYEHDTTLCALSAKYPTTIFKLSGNGDDAGDIWAKWYARGELKHTEQLKIELPTPDLDAMVPRADLTRRRIRIVQLLEGEQAEQCQPELHDEAKRYLAIEFAEIGGEDVALFAMGDDTIAGITASINNSDTERDSVFVYDLDTDEGFEAVFTLSHYISDKRKIDPNGIELA